MTDLISKLEWFRDLKFGFMVHWGPYSQKGYIESWPLSEEDTWARPDWEGDMEQFKTDYWALNRTFDPRGFRPEEWAEEAANAGMKYFVFTTKHHDGFSMYDTQWSDYKITAPDCPYHDHQEADVTKVLFDTFRKKGFAIGAYYSKSDWHSPYYWVPGQPATHRNPNYDTHKHPKIWGEFVEFVHGQVEELMQDYGPIDILWLDGGQVRPPDQDIQMDVLAAKARSHQPGLIIVDRTVGGEHENYLTPEQEIFDEVKDIAWESCITMAKQFSYNLNDVYKSVRELIHMLIEVVGKGGNFLLNVGPGPDGRLPLPAVERLREIGTWMNIHGEAIYNSRICSPYNENSCIFTRRGETVYIFYPLQKEHDGLPERLELPSLKWSNSTSLSLLGSEETIAWERAGDGIAILIPDSCVNNPPSSYACVFKVDGGAN